ncbi:MAG: DNA polymerase II large subunit [Candidatus Nanoarchaeia archaeon]|nr:DNA polymerase II large subunit [Candidatus Nanoarchaeia archaeon]
MTSELIKKYFDSIDNSLKHAYDIATLARTKGYDPEKSVSILLTKNMAERVVGVISVVAPQVADTNIVQRIAELEGQYGRQNWRVAFKLAEEVAQEKFCAFKDKKEAMEIALRFGLAYITNGVVSSPLEGFVRLELKKRKDGKEYFCLYFGGPIRSAGTTATCIFVAIADYIRKINGYEIYDPTEEEIKRSSTEIQYFHDRITNLQYLPSEKEVEFLTSHLPVQIDGDASEDIEVPNYKNLERVTANKLRNGYCLVLAEGLSQKLPKFWGKFSKFNKELGMDHWNFVEDYMKLQKEVKAKGEIKKESTEKIFPNYTYIKDLVAGRPILGYPLRIGGFRLRFGRTRVSGFSSESIHPATMFILNNYIAIGTQLRTERPNKSTILGVCDYIEGPIIKLKNGNVIFVENEEQAKAHVNDVEEILFLGDILINYGDFLVFNHLLVPPGYCEEWWALELEKELKDKTEFEEILNNPIKTKVNIERAIEISKKYKIPLHPRYTYHWKDINVQQLYSILDWLVYAVVNPDKIIFPLKYDIQKDLVNVDPKRVLELLGVPHKLVSNEYVVVEGEWAKALQVSLGFYEKNFDVKAILKKIDEKKDMIEIINKLSEVKLRDKSGIFIGSRMGRPEKAKMRKMIGSPHLLFPVGEEGGKLRCFQSACETGKVTSNFSMFFCEQCNKKTIYPRCEICDSETKPLWNCNVCGELKEPCNIKEHKCVRYNSIELDINNYFKSAIAKLNISELPNIIKGVKGTSNRTHFPENLVKGILRSTYNINVNKDGTIRYDMTEAPITHFKPKEIGTSFERLKELGYEKDIYGKELTSNEQILEIRCQDIILPSCSESFDEGADIIFFRVASFIDDLLVRLYKQEPFYNLKSKNDLVGHLVIAMSPHTVAGIIGRIIGFSKTQGFYTHPLFHSSMRRDCLHKNTLINVYDGLNWKSIPIGNFVEGFNPNRIVDKWGTKIAKINNYSTLSLNSKTNKLELKKIKEVSKHINTKLIKIEFENGRELILTPDHRVYIKTKKGLEKKSVSLLNEEDKVIIPYNINILEKDIKEIDLFKLNTKDLMIRNKNLKLPDNLKIKKYDNFIRRNSYPLTFLNENKINIPKNSLIGVKRDNVSLPRFIKISNDLLYCIGLYLAEGYSRKNNSKKGFYQISFAAIETYIRNKIINTFKKEFSLNPSYITNKSITYSSKLLYSLFVDYLGCGINAKTKSIPSLFLSLPKNKLKYILQGYFDGDGSVSKRDNRVTCDSVSEILLENLYFSLARFGIYVKKYKYTKQPGPLVRSFYERKNRKVPYFSITKLIIPSNFTKKFYEEINFGLPRKRLILKELSLRHSKGTKIELDQNNAYLKVKSIQHLNSEKTYCLNIEDNHNFVAGDIVVSNCDGDEAGIMLMMDAFLNFSRQLLGEHRGATQDEPLVLSSIIIPSEVDDMVFDLDTCWKYPLEFYEACQQYKHPSEIKLETFRTRLGTDAEYEGLGFTHHTTDINAGVRCSRYKTIPTMEEKVFGQMQLAEKIRAVDEADVASLIINRHFLRDIKGNLRKFSQQEFRCVKCNEKFRRPPLKGVCAKCGGKIIFTVAEGSVIKYLTPSISLAEKYELPAYLRQDLELTRQRIESMFGKDKERQEGLGRWFG